MERKVGWFKCKGKIVRHTSVWIRRIFLPAVWLRKGIKSIIVVTATKKCLIYLLTCKFCLKQYIGQTVDEFRLRWNNYNSNNRKHQRLESYMQEFLLEHFNKEGHHGFFEEVSIVFIDQTSPSEPLKRQNYWKSVLKTRAPLGLNIEDSVWEMF